MASKKVVVDLDLKQNELQNAVLQVLSGAPSTPKAGQIWYNSTDHLVYFYNGTSSIPVGYLPPATTSTLGGVIIGTNISVASDGTISVADATNAVKGLIRIATDAEATAGSLTSVAVNPYQLKSAIDTALTGALHYAGGWAITTSTTDYSGITLPVKQGYMYLVTGTGPATVGGVEWNPGDYLVFNKDVAVGTTVTSADVDKIDNTEASDLVRLNTTQTLTNKTIDADDNTISDLTTSNFKSGTIVTTVGPASGTGAATDTELATSKAVRTELDTKQDKVAAGTQYNIVAYSGTQGTFDTLTRVTSVGTVSSASDTAIPTEKAVASAIASAITGTKQVVQNPSLTTVGGVCTWTIANTAATADVVASIREVASGAEVIADVTYTAQNVVVKINSAENIAADTYRAVILS